MTGLSLLLIASAAIILVATLRLIYQHERQQWCQRGHGETNHTTSAVPSAHPTSPATAVSGEATDADEVDLLTGDVAERTRRRLIGNDVFRYTIRRPTAATRKTMPDLGGFSEVPLRLYDQLGNRFTVHQKVRLN